MWFFELYFYVDKIKLNNLSKINRISANKSFLAANSVYFDSLFSGGFKESNEKRIKMNEITGKTLQAIIDFCYFKEIKINMENVEELIHSAKLFQLDVIVDKCKQFLSNLLKTQPEHCLWVQSIANLFSLHEIEVLATHYKYAKFMWIKDSEDFYQLDIDKIQVLLSSNCLIVPKEEDIYHAAMAWVNFDKQNRSISLLTLLRCIRYSKMSDMVNLYTLRKVVCLKYLKKIFYCLDFLWACKGYIRVNQLFGYL